VTRSLLIHCNKKANTFPVYDRFYCILLENTLIGLL
jgi:hypothetical protein